MPSSFSLSAQICGLTMAFSGTTNTISSLAWYSAVGQVPRSLTICLRPSAGLLNPTTNHLLHLLDDFLVVEPPQSNAEAIKDQFLGIFSLLNVPIALHKTDGPTTCLEYLGVILDSHHMEARLPLDKVGRILEALDYFAKKRTCTKRELLSLLGHMNFASKVVRPGRSFVSHLITLSTTVKELHHRVTLNAAIRSDIQMWA